VLNFIFNIIIIVFIVIIIVFALVIIIIVFVLYIFIFVIYYFRIFFFFFFYFLSTLLLLILIKFSKLLFIDFKELNISRSTTFLSLAKVSLNFSNSLIVSKLCVVFNLLNFL